MAELTGSFLNGRYEVLAVVGRGGEGTVVRAVDRRHGRDVALKVRRVPDDPRDAERLLVESRTLLSLPPHPGLPLARDDFFEGDRYVLVLDWVEGVDLWAVLTEHGRPGLPPSTVLRWLAPVAEALTHLHTTGPAVVHGDIKPANLLLTPTGQIVLVDFGMSSTRGLRPRGGTPGFRAPEVTVGVVPTRSADVYGLAATAFALLTGQPPSGILPSWKDIDPERAARLEKVLRRGLATDPGHRTATPGELVEELRAGWDTEALPTGVITFLATEVVSSSRLWQDMPEAAPGLLAEHLLVVDRAVERHGGRRIGDVREGDSTISAFHRAGDAVRAGIDLQRDLAGGRIQVHCAAHTGEARAVDGVLAGTTVSRVARVRALADAGQVLVSATTARLITGELPAGVGLVDLGSHRLDGFDEPETLLAVDAPGLAVPPDPARPPYRGLVPYDVDDDQSYFGRNHETEICLERLAAASLLVVVGPSGSGKSSLVRAGVANRLRQSGQPIAVFTPGSNPSESLTDVLEQAGPTTVLIVDQLEELFASAVRPETATAFLDALVARLEVAPVVVALRADHVGSVGSNPTFARRLEAGLHLVTPMNDDELRDVIEGPAQAAGLRVEPGLVELLLRDVTGEPGGLPLLSFALAETWTNRDGRVLTVDGYLATGGLQRAIATFAERLYEELPSNQRCLARSLFLRLVTAAPDGELLRQRVDARSILTDEDHRQVVDVFVRTRLIVAGDHGLELAHEALVREWPRLRTWLDDDIEGQRIMRHVAVTADTWNSLGQPDSELYRGTRLAQATEWCERAAPDLNPSERTFLDASTQRHERERLQDAERRLREERLRKGARQRTRLLLVASVVLALLGAFTAIAIRQRNHADDLADKLAGTEEARRRAAAASNLSREDPQLSLLLGLAALDVSATSGVPALPEAIDALHWAIQSARVPYPVGDGTPEVRGGPTGRTGIYQLPLTQLVGLARTLVARELTPDECRQYDLVPCPGPGSLASPGSSDEVVTLPREATITPVNVTEQPLAGTTVTIMGAIAPGAGLAAELTRFEELTGIHVTYRVPADFQRELDEAETNGSPPDIVWLSQPALMIDEAREGNLIDLSIYLDPEEARRRVGDHLVDTASLAVGLYGVPVTVDVKGLVWYPAPEFEQAGYTVPTTWAELIALSEQMVADGRTPWCMGWENGATSGSPGTDWVEGLLLRSAGVGVYDRWVNHEIRFDDPTVARAASLLDEVVFGSGFVGGGASSIATTALGNAADAMFAPTPGCWLHYHGSALQSDLPPDVRLGVDTSFFPLPPLQPGSAAPLFGGATYAVAYTDRPEVRELMRWFQEPGWGEMWAAHRASEFLPANLAFETDRCGAGENVDGRTRRLREQLCTELQDAIAADRWRFDASDLMAPELGGVTFSLITLTEQPGGFYQGMLDYTRLGPASLDRMLASLEGSWPT